MKNISPRILKTVGATLLLMTIVILPASLYTNLLPQTPRLTPQVFEGVARDGKIGTYVYDHTTVAASDVVMDDIALMADRVLIDISWGTMMKNDSDNPFDWAKFAFYDQFLADLSARGLELVIQFSPTRSPPGWLNMDLDMNTYRAMTPPTDPVDYTRFETQLMRYVNQTVQFFQDATYLMAPIEWCLADEPNTADWKPILAEMYRSIKILDPSSMVSLVEHKKDLYSAFADTYDMFTIDPYGSNQDLEQKIRLAYEVTEEKKPVRVIISGMARENDYYMIRRQLVLSWFLGAYDIWFWSYNSRWKGGDNEWYVVEYDETAPIHTQRAEALIEGKSDLQRFAAIETTLLDGNVSLSVKTQLSELEQSAYESIMTLEFDIANQTLNTAMGLL